MEQWKPIPKYEGFYEASSKGRIRSVDHLRCTPWNTIGKWRGRVLRTWSDPRRYCHVTLCRKGIVKRHAVHQLVLAAFLGTHPKNRWCNHRDGNPANNALSNLEYVTISENCIHAYRVLKVRHGRLGKKHTAATKKKMSLAKRSMSLKQKRLWKYRISRSKRSPT